MRQTYFVVPGRLDTPTGGFVYDRHMLHALAAENRLAGVISLPGVFPDPAPAAIESAGELIARLPDGACVLVDGLALTPLASVFEREADRLRLLALVHHPLCDETGLARARREALYAAERAALQRTRGILTTSEATARRLADFVADRSRIMVVPPGAILSRPPPRQARAARAPVILVVGNLIPRKAQDLLVRALSPLRQAPWQLRLVGGERDRTYARRLRRLVHALGLDHRVIFAGRASEAALRRHYAEADLFVLPSRHEGYGIAFAEALACGLPVVAPRIEGVSEALPAASARWHPPVHHPPRLTAVLRPLVVRHGMRAALAARARRGAVQSRSWQTAGREFLVATERIILQ